VGPVAIRSGVLIGDMQDGIVHPSLNIRDGPFRVAPIRAGYVVPPNGSDCLVPLSDPAPRRQPSRLPISLEVAPLLRDAPDAPKI
jgi:hypothetical protein